MANKRRRKNTLTVIPPAKAEPEQEEHPIISLVRGLERVGDGVRKVHAAVKRLRRKH